MIVRALLLSLCLCASAGAQQNAEWRQALPAFKLIGNVYWVGTYDLSSLRNIQYGGGPMPSAMVRAVAEAFPCGLIQGYGQTEAAPLISCNRPSAGIRLETVGPPVKNCEVRIAQDGEIMVRGENVMHGYWRNPEETAQGLNAAAGFLRNGLFKRLHIHTVPTLHFVFDRTTERAADMNALISKAVASRSKNEE